MEYTIRMAKKSDLDGLCKIRNNKDLFVRYFKQNEDKEVCLVVAEKDNTILGFGVLKLKGCLSPKLSDLYVKETYRGIGVGSDLIRYREKITSDMGYSNLFVSVDPIENPKMIKLITKLGYSAISEPYIKSAIFYNDEGSAYEKTYTRIDLKKLLT
ncbi:GNAT family N-acetyltransferase [Paenibacillus sp. LHD-38]|uniref:GNAT family N-acetyltransferase n=1 Tax=Paenibacillus sp. LHD-38 TaxID=3072143 RepID=UPI00280F6471|nr:GNAT family N-acetyltransferase [Paenibacillus sp. LHD-38]MDQ8734225.1 GNAT family N-acetyltransferase [Paenibacillus sp. LHD-38]